LPDLAEAKRAARAAALRVRAGCDPALGTALARIVLDQAPPPADALVAGFWPLEGEIDIRPLLDALAARGHRLALPVTPKRGEPLTFRAWSPGAPLMRERFGTMCPTEAAPSVTPDFLLVPLLAFDRTGARLGYGQGFYDRTLPGLPGAGLLGCAFAAQEMAHVPCGPEDVRLPAVATERGVVRAGGAA
jgi:5-formyltetrahydrofolate cyclo-ligase